MGRERLKLTSPEQDGCTVGGGGGTAAIFVWVLTFLASPGLYQTWFKPVPQETVPLKSADTDQAVGGERSGAAGGAVVVAAVDGFWTATPLAALLRTLQLRDCRHTQTLFTDGFQRAPRHRLGPPLDVKIRIHPN